MMGREAKIITKKTRGTEKMDQNMIEMQYNDRKNDMILYC